MGTKEPAKQAFYERIIRARDRNGNTYHALTWTDCQTGRTVNATVCAPNLSPQDMGLEWDQVIGREYCLPARRFDRLTKGWPHAGCTGEEIAAFIRAELEKD